MTSLRTMLRERGSGVLATDRPTDEVLADAAEAGWRTVRLDTAGVDGKVGLMAAAQAALGLPEWFGRNWDALADALSDVTGDPGVLVLWSGAGDLDHSTRATAREILEERAADGRGGFVVVLVDD